MLQQQPSPSDVEAAMDQEIDQVPQAPPSDDVEGSITHQHDPARPSLMQIQILHLSLLNLPTSPAFAFPKPSSTETDDPKTLSAPVTLRVKFRGNEVVAKNVNSLLELPPCEFMVNYHSHKFDYLKVDVLVKGTLKPKHFGRVKIPISLMENWHSETYVSNHSIYADDGIDANPPPETESVGLIRIQFTFSPIILPFERLTSTLDTDNTTDLSNSLSPDDQPPKPSQSDDPQPEDTTSLPIRNAFMDAATMNKLANSDLRQYTAPTTRPVSMLMAANTASPEGILSPPSITSPPHSTYSESLPRSFGVDHQGTIPRGTSSLDLERPFLHRPSNANITWRRKRTLARPIALGGTLERRRLTLQQDAEPNLDNFGRSREPKLKGSRSVLFGRKDGEGETMKKNRMWKLRPKTSTGASTSTSPLKSKGIMLRRRRTRGTVETGKEQMMSESDEEPELKSKERMRGWAAFRKRQQKREEDKANTPVPTIGKREEGDILRASMSSAMTRGTGTTGATNEGSTSVGVGIHDAGFSSEWASTDDVGAEDEGNSTDDNEAKPSSQRPSKSDWTASQGETTPAPLFTARSKAALPQTPTRTTDPPPHWTEIEDESPRRQSRGFSLFSTTTKATLSELEMLIHAVLKNGWRVPKGRTIKAIRMLYRWENTRELPRSEVFVRDPKVLEAGKRFNSHCMSTYGAFLMQISGYGSFKDHFRPGRKGATDHLGLKDEDMLCWSFGKKELYRPRFYICHDSTQSAIVIAVQGTVHLHQVATDLQAEYFPLKDGSVHLGMLRNAQWIIDHHLKDIKVWAKELNVTRIVCTGHSLGGGIATILTFLIMDLMDEIRKAAEKPNLGLHMYGVGTPPVVSKELSDKYGEFFDHFIFESDIVPRLSYGTILDFRNMIIEAARLSQEKATDAVAFAALDEKRRQLLSTSEGTRLCVPGSIYYMYSTVANVGRRTARRLRKRMLEREFGWKDGGVEEEDEDAGESGKGRDPKPNPFKILGKRAQKSQLGGPELSDATDGPFESSHSHSHAHQESPTRDSFPKSTHSSTSRPNLIISMTHPKPPQPLSPTPNAAPTPTPTSAPTPIPTSPHPNPTLQKRRKPRTPAVLSLPPSERPDIPHIAIELARPEQWHFVSPRKNFFSHHMPWEYDRAIREAGEWLEMAAKGALGDGRAMMMEAKKEEGISKEVVDAATAGAGVVSGDDGTSAERDVAF
ncbi:hypothetical protein HDU97_000589 [Phlyctochytrium planicorne]|nr:hypothetical protein HDU97_000589 [Phlyctochytrium planicorne]